MAPPSANRAGSGADGWGGRCHGRTRAWGDARRIRHRHARLRTWLPFQRRAGQLVSG